MDSYDGISTGRHYVFYQMVTLTSLKIISAIVNLFMNQDQHLENAAYTAQGTN